MKNGRSFRAGSILSRPHPLGCGAGKECDPSTAPTERKGCEGGILSRAGKECFCPCKATEAGSAGQEVRTT